MLFRSAGEAGSPTSSPAEADASPPEAEGGHHRKPASYYPLEDPLEQIQLDLTTRDASRAEIAIRISPEEIVGGVTNAWRRVHGTPIPVAAAVRLSEEATREVARPGFDVDTARRVAGRNIQAGWPTLVEPTAQHAVAKYVDVWRETRQYDPPSQVTGQVARESKRLFNDGMDLAVIACAITACARKGFATVTTEVGRLSAVSKTQTDMTQSIERARERDAQGRSTW